MGCDGWLMGSHFIEIYEMTYLLQSVGCSEAISPLHASAVRTDIGEVHKPLRRPSARVGLSVAKICSMTCGLDIMKPQGSKCSDGVSSGSYDDQFMLLWTLCQHFVCLACHYFQFILPVS